MKVFSDYVLIVPDKPKGGTFDAGETYIDETGTIEDCGPRASEDIKKIIGKRIIFNAWACDQKTVDGQKYYFGPESANMIVAVL